MPRSNSGLIEVSRGQKNILILSQSHDFLAQVACPFWLKGASKETYAPQKGE